ncbi:DUF4184 family protein [Paenibacillus dakarensis]|uniref:DUF4184 family protein n=1 Tax=Paenibacillus dakarensis TaxID=1527293 RepID=UPI0006D57159|nr:DUF4184 family protein [Paenibacillus dakarensis]
MPLTFAHPAAVLPFSRKSKYVDFSALVLGSMAPDFEYFLRGRPIGEIGHTFSGFLYFNLPLVILLYGIYHIVIHQTLVKHLPATLQESIPAKSNSSLGLRIIVFVYCAIVGMVTHVVWDAFTHKHGFMVTKFPSLSHTFHIAGYDIPLYKFLQHGSTLLGLSIILVYMYYRAAHTQGTKVNSVPPKQKVFFWTAFILLAILTLVCWYLIDYVSIRSYGVAVVRIIDSAFISLFIMSLFIKYRNGFQ